MKTATSTNRSRINQTNTVVPSILKNYAIDSLIHRSNIKSKTGTTKISFSPSKNIKFSKQFLIKKIWNSYDVQTGYQLVKFNTEDNQEEKKNQIIKYSN